jgi:hypothetical protein
VFSLQLSNAAREQAKARFFSQPMPAVLVPGVLSSAWAAQLRTRLAQSGWEPFRLAHRGHYDQNERFEAPALWDELREFVSQLTGERLQQEKFRWLRFLPGGYALLRDDLPGETSYELQLDLSAEKAPDAEVCYCHRRQVYWVVAPQPGALSLVQRGPTVQRYERYLSKLHAQAELVRLRVWYRPV